MVVVVQVVDKLTVVGIGTVEDTVCASLRELRILRSLLLRRLTLLLSKLWAVEGTVSGVTVSGVDNTRSGKWSGGSSS